MTVAFSDPLLGPALAERGYAVAGQLLDDAQISDLHSKFSSLLAGEALGLSWYTSGMVGDPARRRSIFDAVGAVLAPALEETADPRTTELFAGHFHVNPAASSVGLGPHQDVAIVDERRARSVNGWIPLTDSTVSNGTLRVVEGSHLLGNHDRSLAMDWAFHGLHDLFWELSTPLEVPAGTLILFDTALVHCSGGNRSDTTRVAVNCLMKPAAAPLIHLVCDDMTPPGAVDVYEVSAEHYLSGDLAGRPETRPTRRRPVETPDADTARIKRVCRTSAA